MSYRIDESAVETGCWVDGHWGQYAVTQLIDIARNRGFEVSRTGELAISNYTSGYDVASSAEDDLVVQLGDDALYFINDEVLPDGYRVDWYEGEVFCWTVDEWENV